MSKIEAKHLFCSNCVGMNFADWCTNELESRIGTNCNNIHYKIYKPFEKNYQRLLLFVIFTLYAFINFFVFSANRNNGLAIVTVRVSSVCSSVHNVLYCD